MKKIFLVIFNLIFGVSCKLYPESFPTRDLFLPNQWNSIRDCPMRYYEFGKSGIAKPVAGQPAYEREFAHMAAIGWQLESGGRIHWNCGGSLISEEYVLTAAHCLQWQGLKPSVVRLGDLNLARDDDNKYAQQIEIVEVIPHPQYESTSHYHDIALLKLKTSVKVHDTVCPACLWNNETVKFEYMEACGYGQTGFGEASTPQLLKVILSPITQDECKKFYPPDNDELKSGLETGQLCAADRERIMDTCLGDSGGPLQVKLLGNARMNPFVVGVTSFGRGCATDDPAIYTRVSSYLDWIESTTNIDTDPRRCARKYANYRDYEPDVSDKSDGWENILLDETHVEVSPQQRQHLIDVGWSNEWNCGGVVITESFALTSAACLNGNGGLPDHIRSRGTKEIFEVAEIFKRDDVALIRLKDEIVFSSKFYPTCIWHHPSIPNFQLAIAGDGLRQNHYIFVQGYQDEEDTTSLLHSRAKNINGTECKRFYQSEGIQVNPMNEICFGIPDYYIVPYTCQTILGGSIELEFWRSFRYFTHIVGLNRLGNDCGFGFPVVASQLSRYIAWIDSIIFKELSTLLEEYCILPNSDESTCRSTTKCPTLGVMINEGRTKIYDYICNRNNLYDPSVCCPPVDGSCSNKYKRFRTKYDYRDQSFDAEIMRWNKDSCRGSLISLTSVITTYECLQPDDAASTFVRFVQSNQIFGVSRILSHLSIISLAQLSEPVTPSANLIPICLWSDQQKIPFDTGITLETNTNETTIIHPKQTNECERVIFDNKKHLRDDQSCFESDFGHSGEESEGCPTTGTAIKWYRADEYDGDKIEDTASYLIGLSNQFASCDNDTVHGFIKIAYFIDWINEHL